MLDQSDRQQLAKASLTLPPGFLHGCVRVPLPSKARWPFVIFLAPKVCLLCLL